MNKITAIHTGIFILYMLFVANYSSLLTGNDEHRLGKFGLGITFMVIHLIIGLIHGFMLTRKNI